MFEHLIQFFGRFHPLIVHLPIGLIVLAVVLEFLTRKPKYQSLAVVLPFIWFWGFMSALMACVAGFMLQADGSYAQEAVSIHQYLGIALTVATLGGYCARKYGFAVSVKSAISLISGALLLAAGHFGGNLTHGAEYLTQPALLALGLAEPTPEATVNNEPKKITNINEALVYQEVIQPILKEKCWQCHNNQKQKGQLRMDTQEFLLKGGKHGAIFKANNAPESEMVKRMLLPEGDDLHMPPKGKNQLNDNEIVLIQWWIQQGGTFDKKVADLPTDDKVKPILASLGAPDSRANTAPVLPDVPTKNVSEASAGDLEVLRKLNLVVLPVANESHYLMANAVNAPGFSDDNTSELNAINEQLVWLRLGNTQVGNKGLATIGKLLNLSRLSLEHTNITDTGLINLANLKNLQYLNLFDTPITDKGIAALASLKNLRNLYLYQTKATKAGAEALQKALPNCQIDLGGYTTKNLVSDTTVLKEEKVRK